MPVKKGVSRSKRMEERASLLDNRSRLVAVAMILFAAVLLIFALRKNTPTPTVSAAPEESATSGQGGSTIGGQNPFGSLVASSATPAASSAAPADPPPVIDEVVLEKKEVCAGEENLVTVKTHTTNGTDAFLHTVIDGNMGSSYPVTLWRDDDGNVMGNHTITVFGRGNVATTVPLPQYEVKDCRPTYIAGIEHRVRSNTWSDFDFSARVIGIPRASTPTDRQRGAPPIPVPKPFRPVAFTWTFGDGETATTLTPVTEHDYENRVQEALYSYFVVGVSIRGAKGETATGRISLPLINPAFESLAEKGIVTLLISLEPRFPSLGPDGKVTQHVRVWHQQPGPVRIDRAILTKYYRQGAGQTAPQDVDVASLLGSTTIPPGREGITTTVTLDPASEEEVFSKMWVLRGTSAEGFPATGTFSVLLPPPNPTADASAPVMDPLLKQKIILARQMLGKEFVTDEDIWQLEREGAFANLKVSPEQAATAAAAAKAAAAQAQPPPPTPPAAVPRGPAVPTDTAQQAAKPGQGSGAPPGGK